MFSPGHILPKRDGSSKRHKRPRREASGNPTHMYDKIWGKVPGKMGRDCTDWKQSANCPARSGGGSPQSGGAQPPAAFPALTGSDGPPRRRPSDRPTPFVKTDRHRNKAAACTVGSRDFCHVTLILRPVLSVGPRTFVTWPLSEAASVPAGTYRDT